MKNAFKLDHQRSGLTDERISECEDRSIGTSQTENGKRKFTKAAVYMYNWSTRKEGKMV